MSYHEIEGWIQLEQYFELLGIEGISELEAVRTAKGSDDEMLLGLGAVSFEETRDRGEKKRFKKCRKSRKYSSSSCVLPSSTTGQSELDTLLNSIIEEQAQRLDSEPSYRVNCEILTFASDEHLDLIDRSLVCNTRGFLIFT
ncbi:hypothetical protein C8J56DRAFT_1046935 [Mycena floridula]|nr:hypothetical protein C8J56DRAFT_1046935 [Mycena floridula]